MFSKSLSESEQNAKYILKEKTGLLFLSSPSDFSKVLDFAKLSNTPEIRSGILAYLLKTKFFLYVNAIALPEEFYSHIVEVPEQNNSKDSLADFLLRKGVSHGVLFNGINLNGVQDGLKYNEFLSQKFKYYKQTLKSSFVEVTENFHLTSSTISVSKSHSESLTSKANRLANVVRRAQENGLAVLAYVDVIADRGYEMDKMFVEYENILANVTKAMSDNDVLYEGVVFVVNVLGGNHINKTFKNRRVSHEEVVVRNFVAWRRTIVPAVPLICARCSEPDTDAQNFLEGCLLLNEVGKLEMKGPWEVSYGMGALAWGNSVEFWKGNNERSGLAGGLFMRRLEALKACMGGEFKGEMAKEGTYDARVKEVGELVKIEKKEVKGLKIVESQ